MELIQKMLLTALMAFVVTASKAQQPPDRSPSSRPTGASSAAVPMPMPMARSGGSGEMEKSLETQKVAWAAYQGCLKENDRAFKLYSITSTLIGVRNDKDRYIAAMNDPNVPAKFKQKSYDEAAAEAMLMYRQSGGTAKSITEITPLPNPCAHVEPSPKAPPSRGERGQASPITAKASVTRLSTETKPESGASQKTPVVKTPDATGKPASADQKAPRRPRRDLDARECLKLDDNKAIMACAEKFR